MQKITLSLEETLFAKSIGANYYDLESPRFYRVSNGVVFIRNECGNNWLESCFNLTIFLNDPLMCEIDFSILDEQPAEDHDCKQLALQMAESVYNLSKTLDNLTLEEGVELQKALEAALIVLKETA